MQRHNPILLALLSLSLFFGVAAAAVEPAQPSATDPFVLVQGKWGWASGARSCQNNPQTLTLSADRTEVKLEFEKPETNGAGKLQKSEVYKILDARARLLRTMVVGEPRKDPKGQPLTYDFVFVSDNSYCLHRSDWLKGQCTAPMMVRCPGSKRP
ncbi:MAG TPA: hypothetical protein VGR07_22470 [Thermoanaerobaculia bacterium]|jgi:hypothetical protein|nr:hypothetical protein [Thermoanaerobaculia bacterium]